MAVRETDIQIAPVVVLVDDSHIHQFEIVLNKTLAHLIMDCFQAGGWF